MISTEILARAFQEFRDNDSHHLAVNVRRMRAEQLRKLLSNPDTIDLDFFNREVWVYESVTKINGEKISGFSDATVEPSKTAIVKNALSDSRLELHGNYIWGSGSRVYGPSLKIDANEKLENVRKALRILNDSALPPIEKAKQIEEVPGFGPNIGTGLVMLWYPTQFAIYNKQSKQALKKLGMDFNDLSSFQVAVRRLKETVQADDFLELDAFLYQVNQGNIKIGGEPVVDRAARYWTINAGEGGRLWNRFQSESLISIGWDFLGDLRRFQTKEQISDAIQQQRDDDSPPVNDSLACYQFAFEMRPGDLVFAKQGRDQILGFGRVSSDYIYDETRSEHRNIRRVEWTAIGPWTVPEGALPPTKTLTDVSDYQSFLELVLRLINADKTPPPPPPLHPPYTVEQAMEGLFLSEAEFRSMLDALARKRNIILQGPPGVGKTYIARRLAQVMMGSQDRSKIGMVQFHQSYAYEDFIQGWRPRESGGFERRDGVFHEFCQKAKNDPASNYVFIIDEINRGNLSKIFGELLMLIEGDKRGPEYALSLTYARDLSEQFFVSKNVFLIGMMNTADRSLAMVDYALRRRFTFVDLKPAFQSNSFVAVLEEADVPQEIIQLVVDRMQGLNETIRNDKTRLGPGFEIGHSFFCPQEADVSCDRDWFRSIIRSEIAPLLREYWFDDAEQAETLIRGLLE